jgi:hypothetical protein
LSSAEDAGSSDALLSFRAVHTIELTEEELQLLHSALHAYLDDFGHEEADVLRRIKALIAKLPDAE